MLLKSKAITIRLVLVIKYFASLNIILSLTLALFLTDKMRLKMGGS